MMTGAARPDFLELPATDTEPAIAFYAQAFGWTMTASGPSYACTTTGDVEVAVQADPAERAAAPLICLRVADVEVALSAVGEAGGAITKPLFAFPGGRRFHFRNPAGNELAVYKAGG